jgi:ferritin-like metal-binding protein YciE
MPAPKGLEELFVDTLKDVYHAEKQLVRALGKMAKAAQAPELKEAFETHREETEGQVHRVEQIFELMQKPARAKPCEAMRGLVEEGNEIIEEFKGTEALDAGLLSTAQAVEHYEIARYGTLKSWADQLGLKDAVKLLNETLEEEKKADKLLNDLALRKVNQKAA